MTCEYLRITNRNALRIITIHNPRKKNALNLLAYQELTDALNQAAKCDTVSVVATTGSGEFYSSGNDITQFMSDDERIIAARERNKEILYNMIDAFVRFPKLLVAVVNGPCIGIAATTVALCDIIYATDTAYFSTPFTALGLCPEGCSSYVFPRLLGKSKANEMLLMNYQLSAAEAKHYNFVADVVKPSELETKVWRRLEAASELSVGSLMASKGLLKKFELDDLVKANQLESDVLETRLTSEDAINAMLKFVQRKQSKL
jgi:Delta3-Delta2-enoyl-CoA isomerase